MSDQGSAVSGLDEGKLSAKHDDDTAPSGESSCGFQGSFRKRCAIKFGKTWHNYPSLYG